MKDIKEAIKESDVFVIAEIGMNHDGSLGNALNHIKEASNCGCNAVKFQMHIPEAEMTKNAPNPPYFIGKEKRWDYLKRTQFSFKEWIMLKKYSHELGLYFIVSPFSKEAVVKCEGIGIDAYKIGSGEVSNLPLLEYINSLNKPILLSTGMSNWKEIEDAIKVIKDNLLIIFQCSSLYPCPPDKVGINVFFEMKRKFLNYFLSNNIVRGFSDHTLDNNAAINLVSKGLRVFENHFTLSKLMYGPDAKTSLEPQEMAKYVFDLKESVIISNTCVNKNDLTIYSEMKDIFEKRIVAKQDLQKGTILSLDDLDFKKSDCGIKVNKYLDVIGKKLVINVNKDEEIIYEMLNET